MNSEDNASHKQQLKKRMRIMLICLAVLFGCIILYKIFIGFMIRYGMSHQSQVVNVSTMKVNYSNWQSRLDAVGSVRAIKGVNVTSELAGMVKDIYFTPGATVNKDVLLVQLNIDSDVAQLHALQASADLANITLNRDKKQLAIKGVSQETVDTDAANLKNLTAQVAQQAAIVAKKIIRAPFAGRLGVSAVNPGQYVNPGDKIVTLQQLDPIYIDFYVPQQYLTQLKTGQDVTILSDSFPGKKFAGKITTIDPLIDVSTRNVEIEATVANATLELLPGMFANVTVVTNNPERFLTVPQTAIAYNAYGNIVYVVNKDDKDKNHKKLIAQQRFVTSGETRGDQVTILKGLKEGDEVVTSGQLKLKNNTEVTINNKIVPSDNPNPSLPNDH